MTGSDNPAVADVANSDSTSILVVDDSPVDRALAGKILQKDARLRVDFANDGLQALDYIAKSAPDLVLTDLQMPEMDGLELVETIRRDFPLVPTVLITAHGSEETALTALKRGAASYVPKRLLAARLIETVKDVLEASATHRQQSILHRCWTKTEFAFLLENDTSLIPVLVSHLQGYVDSIHGCDETELVRVGVALHEALRNAIHHGNLELSSDLRDGHDNAYYELAEKRRNEPPYRDRRVKVTASESHQEARYVIEDEGPGFDLASAQYDPDDPAHLERPSGRGLFLIQTFMDEVHFNDRGNCITLVHRRQRGDQSDSLI